MRTLNKLLITIPKDRARVYLVQSFSKYCNQKPNIMKVDYLYILNIFL